MGIYKLRGSLPEYMFYKMNLLSTLQGFFVGFFNHIITFAEEELAGVS